MSTHADLAAKLVLGDRNADYGNPADDFERVSLMVSGLLNHKLKERITAKEWALVMVCVKLAREVHRHKADNLVDGHGYLFTAEWIESGIRPEPDAHSLQSTLEDVCCGAKMACAVCGKPLPCDCEHSRKG